MRAVALAALLSLSCGKLDAAVTAKGAWRGVVRALGRSCNADTDCPANCACRAGWCVPGLGASFSASCGG